MAAGNGSDGGKGPTAPYTSFLTIRNIVRDMKQHSVPTRVDRSVFPNLAGGTVGQVLPAMKFLGLIDPDGHPTDALHSLVASVETDAWGKALGEVVRSAYHPLFTINLEAASPGQFLELFRKTYPGTEDVSRKSQTFFLNAARDAGITISPYIMKNKKPRSGPTKKRAPKAKNAADGRANTQNGSGTDVPPLHTQPKLPSEVLLSLFDGEMQSEEQDAIWTLIKYYKAKGK
jgi:hypothetical protein